MTVQSDEALGRLEYMESCSSPLMAMLSCFSRFSGSVILLFSRNSKRISARILFLLMLGKTLAALIIFLYNRRVLILEKDSIESLKAEQLFDLLESLCKYLNTVYIINEVTINFKRLVSSQSEIIR